MDVAKQLEQARVDDQSATSAAAIEALWARIEPETVAAPKTFLTRLREMPTPRRVGFVLLGTIAISAIVMMALGGAHGGMTGGSLFLRYGLALFGLAVMACAIFAVGLRGAHQRPLGATGWVIVALGVALPLGLSLVPAVWESAVARPVAVVDGCNVIGVATGFFAGVLAWMFQRTTTPVAMRVLASAAGGGVIAFAMLQLHCPADNVEHLILGHSIVGVILVAGAGLGLWLRRMFVGRR